MDLKLKTARRHFISSVEDLEKKNIPIDVKEELEEELNVRGVTEWFEPLTVNMIINPKYFEACYEKYDGDVILYTAQQEYLIEGKDGGKTLEKIQDAIRALCPRIDMGPEHY